MINEVIETLKAYTDGKDNAGKVEISVMQLNRIIKALEQQPTDAVDRVTIKEYLESFEVAHPKMGRWITWKEAGNDIPSETRFECSVCHDAAHTLCNGLDLLSDYCPNCGAKMQEVNDERTVHE